MPLYYQQNINENTSLAIWKIEETENFFRAEVTLQQSITHLHKRLQHLSGRYLLRFLYPDFPNEEIEIADTRKPFLRNEMYHFSISHCGDYAAAIVSKLSRVGVDIELLTNRLHRIKHKFLHMEELRFVENESAEKHLNYLTILWCAKEAMYKWYGLGEVDFSEMMRISPFQLQLEGTIKAVFNKLEFIQEVVLHYKLLNGLTLVWVVTATF